MTNPTTLPAKDVGYPVEGKRLVVSTIVSCRLVVEKSRLRWRRREGYEPSHDKGEDECGVEEELGERRRGGCTCIYKRGKEIERQ